MTLMVRSLATAMAIAVCGSLGYVAAQAQDSSSQKAAPAVTQPQTEMRMYYMVFLRRGPAWTAAPTPEATAVSRAHRANIDRLTKEGLMGRFVYEILPWWGPASLRY